MKDKVLSVVNDYIDSKIKNYHRYDIHWRLEVLVSSNFIKVSDIGTYFSIIIHRNTNLIKINGILYTEEYDFMELYLELERIYKIRFIYTPSMKEIIKQEKIIYNRNKIIETILI